MEDLRKDILIYQGLCHAQGWNPSDKGLKAFLRQQQTGRRDRTGQMIWPGRTEGNHGKGSQSAKD